MKVAIIGGGPAGSHLARILANYRIETTLFDKVKEKEKPCGGAITYRLVREYALFKKIEERANRIQTIKIFSPSDIETDLSLQKPILIFSRNDLDSFLLSQANEAGARIIQGRVANFLCSKNGWTVETEGNSYGSFDFIVGADGASGLSRKKLSEPFKGSNLTQTVGFFIKEATDDCIRLKFYGNLEAYAWSFPRKSNISVGIGSSLGKRNPKELLQKVDQFIERYLPHLKSKERELFSALLPSINPEDTHHLENISGKNWALIGDSCGIIDPITREGIYYAIKTASILGDALMMDQFQRYSTIVQDAFGKDISWAYRNRNRFFKKEFIDTIVEACNRSEEIASIVSELFCGILPHQNLFSRLLGLSLKADISLLGKLISILK